MGEVYLAVDQRLGSAVALKRTFFSDDESLGNAFEREAKTLARLRHTALTKVSDHFTENDLQYLVMEHISGDDLSQRLEQNRKPFPLSWVLFWADQLLDALSYLHSHEPPIIHRDIKPQNLKLTGENHIILLDFGLAKNTVGETRLSTTGNVIAYTPHYASMEQIRGTGTTARSDLYSLSATMYHLLTNDPPADALTRADAVLNGSPDPVRPLSELNPEVAPAVGDVIAKGMSLSSEQRYGSAKEMQLALREAYARMQSGATAAPAVAEIKADESQAKTVVQTPVSEAIGDKTEVMPANMIASFPVVSAESAPVEEVPNFDATIPFVAPVDATPFAVGEPAGEKTEVLPFDVMSSFDDGKTQVSPISYESSAGEKTEVIPPGMIDSTPNQTPYEDAPASFETAGSGNDYNPEATVALVNYGEAVSELPVENADAFVSTPLEKAAPAAYEEKQKPVAVAAKASSGGGSKTLLIVGVLVALLFLGVAGAGVGVYVLKPELFSSATPTPTPTATPTATPTVEPSVTPTVETTPDTSNSNSSGSESNTSTENPTSTPGGETGPISGKTPLGQPGGTPVPTPGRQTTPPPAKTPAAKTPPPVKTPPPAKQPTPDRTKILQ